MSDFSVHCAIEALIAHWLSVARRNEIENADCAAGRALRSPHTKDSCRRRVSYIVQFISLICTLMSVCSPLNITK